MDRAGTRRLQAPLRRVGVACFGCCLCFCLAIDPENLRGMFAIVSGDESIPEQREEDGSEALLVTHASQQRLRHRSCHNSSYQDQEQTQIIVIGHSSTTLPALAPLARRGGISMPMRC